MVVGVCMVAGGHAWLPGGWGHEWLWRGACMVARGCAWLQGGCGGHGWLLGGMYGCHGEGVCMVVGGVHGYGGMHGCGGRVWLWGCVYGCGGACVVVGG